MEFGGDIIKFNVYDSIKNPNDSHSCFVIDVHKDIGPKGSTLITKDVSRTTIGEELGVIALQPPNMAESSHGDIVERAADFEPSPQYVCKSSIPISIPISINRLLPSLVQVPNRFKGGGSIYMDFRHQNTTIREDHYPLPFIEPYYESVEGHVIEELPLHAVGSNLE